MHIVHEFGVRGKFHVLPYLMMMVAAAAAAMYLRTMSVFTLIYLNSKMHIGTGPIVSATLIQLLVYQFLIFFIGVQIESNIKKFKKRFNVEIFC